MNRLIINIIPFIAIVSHFLLDFLVSFFNPLGPYLIEKFSIEVRLFTTFLTLSSAIASLLQIFFGFWFDSSVTTKKYIVLMYFLEALGITILGVSTNFWVALLAIFIIRIANSAFHPLGASMAGEGSGKSVAIFSIAGTLGAALGPIFISFYVSKLPLSTLWVVSVPFLIIAYFMVKLKVPNKSTNHNKRITFKEFSVLIPILQVVTIRSFLMSVVHMYTPIFVTNIRGYPITLSGTLITSGMLTGVFANYIGVLLLEKIGAKKQDFVAFVGMALSIFALLTSKSFLGLFFSFVFFDFSGFLLMSANVVQAQKILPNRKAFASSVAMGFAWSIGDFIASAYNSVFGNDVKLSLTLVIPIAIIASIYFGIIQKFDTK
ncbi:MAG: MFS transporter [Fervidobacterium sp.]